MILNSFSWLMANKVFGASSQLKHCSFKGYEQTHKYMRSEFGASEERGVSSLRASHSTTRWPPKTQNVKTMLSVSVKIISLWIDCIGRYSSCHFRYEIGVWSVTEVGGSPRPSRLVPSAPASSPIGSLVNDITRMSGRNYL